MDRIKEIYEYRTMFWSLTLSELRTKYKGSILGFLWTFLNPLLMLIVYSIVFSIIMKSNLPHYPAFLFIGILAWNMFSISLSSTSGVIIRQSSLVKKIYFPREILPLSIVASNVINYIFSLLILIPFLLVSGIKPSIFWLLLPVILLFETITIAGFSLFFSSINVYLRDVEHVLNIFLMAWFYITPVVYSIKLIPTKYHLLFKLNPMTDFEVLFQSILYYHQPLRWKMFLYSVIFSIMILYIGWKVFIKLNRRFAEEI
ncbi:ABC transporter permease [Alicyclobacillus sp. TC]|nr:ABC transporter permease [Alicyclobacillus sp. TC]